jgi:hypothetical protein
MELVDLEIGHQELHADISHYFILIYLHNSDWVFFVAVIEIELLLAVPLESTVTDRLLKDVYLLNLCMFLNSIVYILWYITSVKVDIFT